MPSSSYVTPEATIPPAQLGFYRCSLAELELSNGRHLQNFEALMMIDTRQNAVLYS